MTSYYKIFRESIKRWILMPDEEEYKTKIFVFFARELDRYIKDSEIEDITNELSNYFDANKAYNIGDFRRFLSDEYSIIITDVQFKELCKIYRERIV